MAQESSSAANFTQTLGIQPGDVVSIVGCGGKTSLQNHLSAENCSSRVLLSTTTQIRMPDISEDVWELTGDIPPPKTIPPGICVAYSGKQGEKLLGISPKRVQDLVQVFDYSFLECDGSKRRPLKGWADWEPVVPPSTTITIGVCTLWPEGQLLSEENTHRLPLFTSLTGGKAGERCTLEQIAAMVSHEAGMFAKAVGRRILLINQVDTSFQQEQAKRLVEQMPNVFSQELWGIFTCSVHKQLCAPME